MVYTSPNSLPVSKSDLRHDDNNTAPPLYYSSHDYHYFLFGRSRIPPAPTIAPCLFACVCKRSRQIHPTSPCCVDSTTVVAPSFSYHDVQRWRKHCTQLEDSLADGANMTLACFHPRDTWNWMNERDASHFQRHAPHLRFNLLRLATIDRAVEEGYTRSMYERNMENFDRARYDETERRFAKLRNPALIRNGVVS